MSRNKASQFSHFISAIIAVNKILTDEMAELLLKMKMRKPYIPAELAKKMHWEEERVQRLLDEMADLGIVECANALVSGTCF